MSLIDYVRALENKDNKARRQEVVAVLQDMGITPGIQECRWLRVKNIIADFSPEKSPVKILFAAHYDSVAGSPGANDNASGVAVLLGLCRELKSLSVPARVVFFDKEEAWFRTPLLRLGLLGSLCYVCRESLKDLSEVYNLEFCGRGDVLAVWPVGNSKGDRQTIKRVEEKARHLSLPYTSGYVPWYFISSDHLPFRFKGIDAITLSMLPGDELPVIKQSIKGRRSIFPRNRKKLPDPLFTIHTGKDNSKQLDEHALQRMLSLTLELAQTFV